MKSVFATFVFLLAACSGGGGATGASTSSSSIAGAAPSPVPSSSAKPAPSPASSATATASAAASPPSVTASPAPSASPTSLADLCFGHVSYAPSFVQAFTDTQSWRYANGGKWFEHYPWGRQNPGAVDEAYYIDGSENIPNAKTPYDPFSMSGGALAFGANLTSNVSGVSPASVANAPVLSAMIASTDGAGHGYAQRYGYYEVKAQLPLGQGLWPSFWMLDANGARNEIDVFEFLGNDPTTIYQSYTKADYAGSSTPVKVAFDPTKGFHTYGVLVTPTSFSYYIDGTATTTQAFDNTQGPMYFMISMQVGGPGSWPGPPNASTPWPSELLVNDFHAFAPVAGSHC